jgi:imidazolonepropionase-like amidohydrolase
VLRALPSTLLVLAALLAAGCTSTRAVIAAAGAPVDGNSFVVRNVRVFDGTRTFERVNVVVTAGRISAIGRAAPPAGLPVIDGSGRPCSLA